MAVPSRVPVRHLGQKLLAAAGVAVLAAVVALVLWRVPGARVPVGKLDHLLYDSLYKFRPAEDRTGGPVVIIAVDQKSLDAVDAALGFGWPWPRDFWATLVSHLDACGARAVVFDLLFTETSAYDAEFGDDTTFAEAVAAAKVPVVFPTLVKPDGSISNFALELESPVFGAANVSGEDVVRTYAPVVHGRPSLASQVLAALGSGPAVDAAEPFLLHYYGPHVDGAGRYTFRYVSAAPALARAMNDPNADPALTPEVFRDKIVLIGAIAAGTYDLKSTPVSALYPGVEGHATAIENMLAGRRVHRLGFAVTGGVTLLGALLASAGVLLTKRTSLKVLAGGVALAAVLALGAGLFMGETITWLPMAPPLIALGLATLGAFAWSYLTEDRQRRLILKAFAQYVSPAVADRIAQNPGRITLGGERREMTVMFTDMRGFTDMTENMQVEDLTLMLNFYLEQMSGVVLQHDGTVDKYIGDAIMSFWNAPVDQPDHAILACRAALGMKRKEDEIRPRLEAYGARNMLTRIGLNSGVMAVGNMGSDRKINYTVLGDSVNLASRLEGANKFYGTQIMLAQSTAELVRGHFALRKVDVLRVKGKQQPMAVYELLDEGAGDERTRSLIDQYERALELYRSQRWDDAESALLGLLIQFPDDAPAKVLLERVQQFSREAPPTDWDGVYVAKDK